MILKIAYRPLSGYEQPFCKKFCKTDTPLSWTALNHFFLLLGLLICANSSLSVLFRPSIRISLSSIREFKSSHLWKPSNFLCGTCVYSLYPELYNVHTVCSFEHKTRCNKKSGKIRRTNLS